MRANRGKQEDPAVFAALATSMSLSKSAQPQSLQQALVKEKNSMAGFIGSYSPHDFFAPFSSKSTNDMTPGSSNPAPNNHQPQPGQRTHVLRGERSDDPQKSNSSLPVVLLPMKSKNVIPLAPKTTANTLTQERDEMESLKKRYAALDSSSLSASVERQVEAWSLNRARLEEEIIRRQEASRFASPSVFNSGLSLSAYHHVSAAAKDEDSNELGRGGGTNHNLAYLTSIVTSARDERHKAAAQFETEKQRIESKIPTLAAESIYKALQPVPDKTYLECIAKLPRPEHDKAAAEAQDKKALVTSGSKGRADATSMKKR